MSENVSSEPSGRFRVLFLCTANSARSQMAEAILSRYGGDGFEVASAGTHPAAEVHPMAMEELRARGIDWSRAKPKGIERVLGRKKWDLVITVCDNARESCPVLPGQTLTVHWGLDDPAVAGPSEADRRRAFHDTAVALSRRIDLLWSSLSEGLHGRALKWRLEEGIGEV